MHRNILENCYNFHILNFHIKFKSTFSKNLIIIFEVYNINIPMHVMYGFPVVPEGHVHLG